MTEEKEQKEQKKPTRKQKNLEVKKLSVFAGTGRRKQMMQEIIQICREELKPSLPEEDFICQLSWKTGLTRRKLKEDYIDVLISNDILQMNKGAIELGIEEKNI